MEIAYLRERGYSGRAIAHALGRGKSSVADELVRNRVQGRYDPRKAHHKAYVRRKYAKYQGMRIVHHAELRAYVEDMLMDDLSPEAVAGRLRYVPELPRVSARTIRRFMASVYGRRIETHRWLRRQRRRRHRRQASLPPRTFIDRRPLYINARRKVGDAEADFIVSGKTGRGILLTVADRRTRHTFLEKVMPVSIPHMEAAFLRIKRRFPEMRSITTDNDILFRHHARLATLLHIRIFFCHPYHAWEKGSVENVNRAIRRDIPKGASIARFPSRVFRGLEAKLNRRPLACLNYRMPAEMLLRHRMRGRKQKRPARGCPD